MTEQQLNKFLELFVESLDGIKNHYYRTVYEEMEMIAEYLSAHEQQNIIGNDLIKTGERIFCYELYHQIRRKIEDDTTTDFNSVRLQGELRKAQIQPLLDRFGLERLSKNFIPDFLLHSPGTADDHPYVIEVKATRRLNYVELHDDIDKISEFLIKYHYQRGIFLAVNISTNNLISTIKNCELIQKNEQIHTAKENILIISKENEHIATEVLRLNEII